MRFRALFEAALVLLCARILTGRNVARSGVTSRRDNNAMWLLADQLEDIARRIASGYR